MWIAGALLLSVGSVWVLWSLWRPRLGDAAGRDAERRALYRDRLLELEREQASGLLDESGFAEARAELDANLLAEWQGEAAPALRPAGRLGLLGWVLGGLLPLLALGVYWQVGEPDAPQLVGAESVLRLPEDAVGALDQWAERLEQRVRRAPDDAKSWYLLGHVFLKQSRYQRAADAFGQAHGRHGADLNIDLYWLQARYLAAGGRLDAGARQIAERILGQAPNHPLVLEIFSIEAFKSGDFDQAVRYLNQALSNPLSDIQRATLQAGLNEARARLGTGGPGVDVAVELAQPAPAGATLFVIARPVGGGMPYAVIRRSGGELGRQYRLDDAVSMNPAAPLSQAEQFEVVVRLSLNGSVRAGPGDWEWRSDPLALEPAPGPLTAKLSPPA